MLIDIYPASLEAVCQSLGIVRSVSQSERDAIDDSDFAGPHQSFPIDSQAHLDAAAKLIGHADDPEAVKAKAIAIAKRKGLTLPDSWQEESKERALPDGILALDGYSPHMTFPIVRNDPEKWMVYGRATVEEPDHHGTIFSYEGAKGAFARWKGNIREQHDLKKAVGKRVDYAFNDQEKGVYLTARVSKGAPDTWQKIMDDVLCDFSVNVLPSEEYGTNPRNWPKKEYKGKLYPYLPEYDYAEISLVDSGSAPGTQFTPIVRADGSPTELLAALDEPATEQPPTLERAGARVSADTRAAMHQSIAHTLKAAVSQMKTCSCDNCMAAQKVIDPDGDGDIDIGSFDDPDGDASTLSNGRDGDMDRMIAALLERALSPVYARLQGIAGTLSRNNPAPNTQSIESIVSGAITRAIEATTSANESSLATVRADLSAVKETVGKIANTPMPGAPIANTSALPRPTPTSKTLPTDPYQPPQRSGSSVYDAIARMSEQGMLDTPDRQADAVAAGLMAQRTGRY